MQFDEEMILFAVYHKTLHYIVAMFDDFDRACTCKRDLCKNSKAVEIREVKFGTLVSCFERELNDIIQ